jgi:hypothetical protein
MQVKRKSVYRVTFFHQGKVYELHARQVNSAPLFGFIEVEELIFSARSEFIVDPSEEKLKDEFAGVRKTYLPMHTIIRIDEVDKEGVSKIVTAEGENVTPFPVPVYTPGGNPKS